MAYVDNGEPRRDKAVNVPVSAEEREFLRAAAQESGLAISAIMRDGGFAEAQKQIGAARLRRAEAATAV